MPKVRLNDITLHYLDEGPRDGAPLVLAHCLGLDQSVWDAVVPLLPDGLRIIRYDMRGHGGSEVPDPPYRMGALVRDAEALLDHLEIRDAVFVGLSIGGLVAQGLAVKRMDQVRALVLAATAAKIGQPAMWEARADTVLSDGLEAIAGDVLIRWFGPRGCKSPQAEAARHHLMQADIRGYAGGCMAIAGTDFYTPTSGLRLPCLGLGGTEDTGTPPDLVRETVGLIPGSRFEVIRQAGHLICIDQPEAFARHLSGFLHEIGHI